MKRIPGGKVSVQEGIDKVADLVIEENSAIGGGVHKEISVRAPGQKALLRVRVPLNLRRTEGEEKKGCFNEL